jgi:adenosylcobinamide kinase / adenosylcobinamide-phosphate guanylyltransferase
VKEVTLLTGGGRSGKSSEALKLAGRYLKKAFIATAEPIDVEMEDRIAKHKAERGDDYFTVESPIDIAGAIRSLPADTDVVVVDCLTVWLANLMHRFGWDKENFEQVDELTEVIKNPPFDMILITNEIGMGIIPIGKETRNYRDVAGRLNQLIASLSNRVIFMVSGLPIVLKDERRSKNDGSD